MSKIPPRESQAEAILDTLRLPLLLLDADNRVLRANREYYRAFRQSAKASVGQFLSKLGDGQWDFKSLRARVALVVSRDEAFKNFEVSLDFKKLGRRTLLLGGLRLRGAGGGTSARNPKVLLTFEDITELRKRDALLKEHAQELTRTNRDLEKFASIAARELLEPLRKAVAVAESISGRYKWKAAAGPGAAERTADIGASGLTPREREILVKISEGALNKEIAANLLIGLRTVQTHRQSLMKKLDIRTSADLTKYALASGLITLR